MRIAVPSTTATATRACAAAGSSPTSPDSRASPTSSARSSVSGDPFGSGFGARGGPAQGADVAVEVELTLEEAAHGVTQGSRVRRSCQLRALSRQPRRARKPDRDLPALRRNRSASGRSRGPRWGSSFAVRSAISAKAKGRLRASPARTARDVEGLVSSAACRSMSRPGSTTASESGSPAGVMRAPAAARTVTSTCLPRSALIRGSSDTGTIS